MIKFIIMFLFIETNAFTSRFINNIKINKPCKINTVKMSHIRV